MRILTFDIEEWFHLLDNSKTKGIKEWSNFHSRIRIGMEFIFEILEKCNVSATFFVVGWIAEKYPDIIKEITNKVLKLVVIHICISLYISRIKQFFLKM